MVNYGASSSLNLKDGSYNFGNHTVAVVYCSIFGNKFNSWDSVAKINWV